MACASTVAVVVPSPAVSEVFDATSLTIWAPRFAKRSSTSISLATVTPSFVTVGEPHDFSMTTLRPRGPRVALTVSARMFTPSRIRLRPAASNKISLADICSPSRFLCVGLNALTGCARLLLENAEDLVLAQDDVVDAVDLDLAASVLAEQHAIALLHVEGTNLALVVGLAGPDRDHLALTGLLLRGVGNDDAPSGLLFLG